MGLSAENGLPRLRRMAAVQAHRGPDGDGFAVGDRWGLAHRRLAIIDKEGGEQPKYSADDRYVLTYNGEVYNYRELREELRALGHSFKTVGDTEVVLTAWVEWGQAAFDRFDGMFALAIADTVTGELVLARDQFGIKPLYLAEAGNGTVIFASEIRPILASGLIERRPDDVTIYRYLRYRVHDDTERTFFAGIRRLLPGELTVISPDGQVSRSTYTSLYRDMRTLAANPQPYDEAARQRFAESLRAAVRSRLVSDVPIGTALSGGLDSSTVVATVNELLVAHDPAAAAMGVAQQSFSAVFPGERNDEERYVDALAERCSGLGVHKVRPDVDTFLAELRDFVIAQEEPVISTGPYAQYCVMREASKHVKVMLDGQGADEMMAGYVPYFVVNMRDLARTGRRSHAARELSGSVDILWRLGKSRVSDAVFRRSGLPVTTFLDRNFVAAHADERLEIIPDDLKARLEDDLFRHSLPALLRYEDRNTMWFSVEGRVPFLTMDLVRTLWALDNEAILHKAWNKRALRDATANILPAMINRRRNKIGFTTPEDAWFTTMADYIQNVFEAPSFGSRPYFDQAAVLSAFASFRQGDANTETMTFWRMLNVELWLQEFIDQDPCAATAEEDPRAATAEEDPRAATAGEPAVPTS